MWVIITITIYYYQPVAKSKLRLSLLIKRHETLLLFTKLHFIFFIVFFLELIEHSNNNLNAFILIVKKICLLISIFSNNWNYLQIFFYIFYSVDNWSNC